MKPVSRTSWTSWTSVTALIVAGAMLAGSALAQSTTPGGDSKAGEMKNRQGAAGAGQKAAGSEQVKAVQQALKDKGHDPGAVDGKMGPKTQAALREFQKQEGLSETGGLDAQTREKLGIQAGAGAPAPSASPSASPPAAGKKQ
jgi:peptidoglycan hydrolase-like protein with peptidoglycan-binding domain